MWTPKLNLSVPSGPQHQDLPSSSSLPEALRAELTVLTTPHRRAALWRTLRNHICPAAARLSSLRSSILSCIPWGYLLKALCTSGVPVVCFPLHRHLLSPCSQGSGWVSSTSGELGPFPVWSRQLPLKVSAALRWPGSELGILQPVLGLFWKAWLFWTTLQTCLRKSNLRPALQEVRRREWKSDPWPPRKPRFNHCHLWNALPGEFYYSFLTT